MEWKTNQIISPNAGIVTSIVFSPNNPILAASTDRGIIFLYDLIKNEIIQTKSIHSQAINQIVWSKNGEYIVSCSNDEKIKLLNSQDLTEINTPYEGYDCSITCCDISFSCDLITAGDEEGRILLFPTSSPDARISDEAHTDCVTSIHFSQSSLYILTSGLDGIVRILSPEKLFLLRTFCEESPISNAMFTPDRRYIILSPLESITHIVQVHGGKTVRDLKGYVNQDYLLSPVFHYDRNEPEGPVYIIIPSEDGKLISYDFSTQAVQWEFQPHQNFFKFNISPDGMTIATASIDSNQITIWSFS